MKPLDWTLAVVSVGLTLASAWLVLTPSTAPARVEVQADAGTFVYPLNEDRVLPVAGPLGTSHVHIEGGQVWVHDSPCTNQVCVAMGRIDRGGQFVSCLPNRIFVRVTGGAANPEEAVDAGVW